MNITVKVGKKKQIPEPGLKKKCSISYTSYLVDEKKKSMVERIEKWTKKKQCKIRLGLDVCP